MQRYDKNLVKTLTAVTDLPTAYMGIDVPLTCQHVHNYSRLQILPTVTDLPTMCTYVRDIPLTGHQVPS